MIPVRAAGCVHMRTHVLSSSRFAPQLLHSAGFADVQCSAHVTALPGFSQNLPGGSFSLICFSSTQKAIFGLMQFHPGLLLSMALAHLAVSPCR